MTVISNFELSTISNGQGTVDKLFAVFLGPTIIGQQKAESVYMYFYY